jgi:hypothetical protein
MLRPRLTWSAALALLVVGMGPAGCTSNDDTGAAAEGTTSGSGTTSGAETGSESTGSMPVTSAEDTAVDDGPGSIACGPMLCSEGLLCVREITYDDMGVPVSEWFCRSKPTACGDGPGDCACALDVCYNAPCSCQDTGANRFTCTNDGTCSGSDETTAGESTDTGTEGGDSSSSSG